MSNLNLRKKPRISYCEYEEPNLDEYVYCTKCTDYVYEYCSIHGPLLVIADDKVSSKTGVPSFVPRAALTIPQEFLHIAPSVIPGAGLGVFSSMTLPADVRFGPYRGQLTKDIDSAYCWMLHDGNNKWCRAIDAADPNSSNWMRYVNCARHYREQNLVAYQYQGQIYYRTIKIIPRFTELMVFYGGELAQILGINLRLYNEPDGFAQVLASPILAKTKDTNISEEKPENELIIAQRGNLKTYYRIHAMEKPYICDICDKRFTKNFNLKRHYRSHTKEKPYKCNVCSMAFIESSKLKIHYRVHTKEKPFKCDVCSMAFIESSNLKRHYRVHTKEKPCKCDVCSMAFIESSSLKRHYRVHTKDKPFKCDVCSMAFIESSSLKRHYRVHTKEKPYKCDVCSMAFIESSSIKRHYRVHTKDKPFKCDVCSMAFIENSSLKRHYRVHTKEKPYKCDVCSMAFSSSSSLKRHYRVHTKEKPYKCDVCSMAFSSSSSLKRHYRVHTKEKPRELKT